MTDGIGRQRATAISQANLGTRKPSAYLHNWSQPPGGASARMVSIRTP
jgi:hypothetical protein